MNKVVVSMNQTTNENLVQREGGGLEGISVADAVDLLEDMGRQDILRQSHEYGLGEVDILDTQYNPGDDSYDIRLSLENHPGDSYLSRVRYVALGKPGVVEGTISADNHVLNRMVEKHGIKSEAGVDIHE